MPKIYMKDITIPKYDCAFIDILEHKHTHYWFSGGRGSTKSSFISTVIPILLVKNAQCHALILRKVSTTLKDSVYNQILWAIDILGLSAYFKTTISPLEITYIPTGQKIYFRGADDPVKIKSIKPKFGYMGVTWFEELDQFKGEEEVRNILQSVNRGGDKYWNFYSFNPPKSRDNWVNVVSSEEYNDKLVTHNTYLDVPIKWLGEQFVQEAEKLKEHKPAAYEHEYMGIATGTGGAVFENLETREILDSEILTLDYFYYGVDFGFAIDPFAWCKVAFNRKTNTLWVLDELYETKLSNSKAVEKITSKLSNKHSLITADSAEPRTINEFNDLGLNVIAAKKGKDSVDNGIKWLQSLDAIIIDKGRTPNAYNEFTFYEYEIDRYGNYISQYPDKNNHYIDAVRYALESVILDKKVKTISRSKLGGLI